MLCFFYRCRGHPRLSKTGIGFWAPRNHLTFKDDSPERSYQSRSWAGAVTHHRHPHHLCCRPCHHPHQIFTALLCWKTQHISEGVVHGTRFPYRHCSSTRHLSYFETHSVHHVSMRFILKDKKILTTAIPCLVLRVET